MENIKYLDFLKEIKERDYKEISLDSLIKNDVDINIEMAAVIKAINKLQLFENLFETMSPVVENYMKKSIIFFEMIKSYTILEIDENQDIIENYDIILEEHLKENKIIKRFYNGVYETLKIKEKEVLNQLIKALNNIPNIDEIEKMKKDFEELFSEENSDAIKRLDNIVQFNDPSMKMIKDVVYNSAIESLDKNINENKKE